MQYTDLYNGLLSFILNEIHEYRGVVSFQICSTLNQSIKTIRFHVISGERRVDTTGQERSQDAFYELFQVLRGVATF